jgi:hypothetical protein
LAVEGVLGVEHGGMMIGVHAAKWDNVHDPSGRDDGHFHPCERLTDNAGSWWVEPLAGVFGSSL